MTNEELVEQIQNGVNVKENMGLLYEQNIGFITKIVHPFSAYAEEEDLMQEAYIGLHKAVEGFDASKGVLFLTYAPHQIRQQCRIYLDNYARTKRIPVHMLGKMREYKKLLAEHHGNVSEEIVRDEIGLTKKQYDFMMQVINQESVVSIDTQIRTDADDNLTIGDCLADSVDIEGDAVENDCKNRIWGIVDNILNDKQKDVITSYFMNQQTYSAIGETMGCSRERIRQIKEKALSILKEINELQDLAEFWGYDSMMAYTGRNRVEYLVLKKLEYEEKIQKKTAQFENTMLAITKNQQACIVERIEELCREKHISKRKLEMEAGLGTGSISKWNKFRPRKASLQRVADYFGLELEFLIGNS